MRKCAYHVPDEESEREASTNRGSRKVGIYDLLHRPNELKGYLDHTTLHSQFQPVDIGGQLKTFRVRLKPR